MTITLPPRIEEALNNKGAEYNQSGIEFLKNFLFAACHAKEGMTLKLDLPPAKVEIGAAQPLLPLGGGSHDESRMRNAETQP